MSPIKTLLFGSMLGFHTCLSVHLVWVVLLSHRKQLLGKEFLRSERLCLDVCFRSLRCGGSKIYTVDRKGLMKHVTELHDGNCWASCFEAWLILLTKSLEIFISAVLILTILFYYLSLVRFQNFIAVFAGGPLQRSGLVLLFLAVNKFSEKTETSNVQLSVLSGFSDSSVQLIPAVPIKIFNTGSVISYKKKYPLVLRFCFPRWANNTFSHAISWHFIR